MKIERIAFNKLRVFVSFEDLEALGMNFDKMTSNPKQANDMFWALIKRAEYETGFKAGNDARLVVEAMPSGKDGLILYITRVGDEIPVYNNLNRTKVHPSRVKMKKVKSVNRDETHLLKFSCFEDLCDFSKRINSQNISSTLYHFKDKYYLSLKAEHASLKQIMQIAPEYAERVRKPFSGELFLKEHGCLIKKDAALNDIQLYF